MIPKPKKIKKPKAPTVSKVKKQAWEYFSKYIRMRNANSKGFASCVTCGAYKHWKELQAGHFIPGRNNSILFDERGCFQQCYRCNVPLKSNPRAYDAFMRSQFGEEIIKELEDLDRQIRPFKVYELEEIRDLYKNKVAILENMVY